MNREQYLTVKTTFAAFVNNKANHPTRDKTYGTKYPGHTRFHHFILYAVLRGQDPATASHNPQGKTLLNALAWIDRVLSAKPSTEQAQALAPFVSDVVPEEVVLAELRTRWAAYRDRHFRRELKQAFKAFVQDPKNRPTRDTTYGTQYPGKVNFRHFILYAILRQKDPAKTTHDITSKRYQAELEWLEQLKQEKISRPALWEAMEPFVSNGYGHIDIARRVLANWK